MVVADQILDALDALAPLGDLPRTGWVVRGCAPVESIAAHTVQVALLAAMLVDELRAEGVGVDGEAVMRMALCHDAAEARTGDVPMPVKQPALAEALHAAEDRVVGDMLPPALVDTWRAAAGPSVEAELCAAADKLQLLAQALRYQRRGMTPTVFDTLWTNPDNRRGLQFAPVRRLYAALYERAGRPVPADVAAAAG